MRRRDKDYYRKAPHKHVLKANKRRIERLKRTPEWLTTEQLQEIKQFYVDSEYLTYYTKVEFQVDHIIPLQGKKVSGLNVPSNLQLLMVEENIIKSNKFTVK